VVRASAGTELIFYCVRFWSLAAGPLSTRDWCATIGEGSHAVQFPTIRIFAIAYALYLIARDPYSKISSFSSQAKFSISERLPDISWLVFYTPRLLESRSAFGRSTTRRAVKKFVEKLRDLATATRCLREGRLRNPANFSFEPTCCSRNSSGWSLRSPPQWAKPSRVTLGRRACDSRSDRWRPNPGSARERVRSIPMGKRAPLEGLKKNRRNGNKSAL
jgi:hypothetical protein